MMIRPSLTAEGRSALAEMVLGPAATFQLYAVSYDLDGCSSGICAIEKMSVEGTTILVQIPPTIGTHRIRNLKLWAVPRDSKVFSEVFPMWEYKNEFLIDQDPVTVVMEF